MKRLLVVLVALAAATTACSPTNPYAAVVNGQVIKTSTIDDEIHAVTSNPKYAAMLDSELTGGQAATGLKPGGDNTVNANYVAQLVYNRVLVSLIDQEVEAKHLVITPDQRKTAEDAVRNADNDPSLFDSLAANYRAYLVDRQAKLSAVVASRNTPEAQSAYYDANLSKFRQTCVRHILVNTQDEAATVRTRIVAGEDFAAIAKAQSLDNQAGGGSAAQGGDLGCYSDEELDQFVASFRDATKALAVNEISQPVQSSYGYHVIQVTSRAQQTFAQAQPAISQQLGNPSAFFSEALKDATIKVNPRYGEFTPADPATGTPASVEPHQPVKLSDGSTGSGSSGIDGSSIPDGAGSAEPAP